MNAAKYVTPRQTAIGWIGQVAEISISLLAVTFVVLAGCSQVGLIDWRRIQVLVAPPWSALLTTSLAPKTIRILAGEGCIYLLVQVAMLFVERPIVRQIIGPGSLIVLRRALGFVWPAVFVALSLLSRVSPYSLRTEFTLRGDAIVLTLPTLVGTVIFGAAVAGLLPGRRATFRSPFSSRDPSPRRGSANPDSHHLPGISLSSPTESLIGPVALFSAIAPLLVGLGVAVSLEYSLSGVGRSFLSDVGAAVIAQATLLTIEIAYVLLVLEALLADVSQARETWSDSVARGVLSVVRAGGRVIVFVGPIVVGLWLAFAATLPSASIILDRRGDLVQYYDRNGVFRLATDSSEIAPAMYQAIDAVEDPGSYSAPLTHSPINPVRVAGIFTTATRSFDSPDDLSGGSGIAVQSCKNLVGRPLVSAALALPSWLPVRRPLAIAATVVEKVAFEFPCGWAFERAALPLGLGRSPVTFYLNEIYFGQNAYGVQAASLTYFGKNARDLSVPEAALLAGLPQAPGFLDPWHHSAAVRQRRHEVLLSMVRQGYLSAEQAAVADAAPLGVLPARYYAVPQASGFVQYLMQWLDAHDFRDVSTAGLTITTSLDLTEQETLRRDVAASVRALENRGVNNGGAIEIDPRSGAITAWVAGVAKDDGPYLQQDMVSQFPHQPGSTIKPLLYACALENGALQPDDLLNDTQRVIGGKYIANWDLLSRGVRPAAQELSESRNTAAAELVDRTTPSGFANCLRNVFQIRTDLHPSRLGVELGLGLAEMPMEELADAFTPLATGGIYRPTNPVVEIRSARGAQVFRADEGTPSAVISCQTAAWVTRALRDVSAMIGVPPGLATKTGTTPSSSYAVGYGRDVILAAWVGRTEPGLGRLSIDDVYGREGGGQIWKAVATREHAGAASSAITTCQ